MDLKIGHLTVNAMVLKDKQRLSLKKQSEKGQRRRTMLVLQKVG